MGTDSRTNSGRSGKTRGRASARTAGVVFAIDGPSLLAFSCEQGFAAAIPETVDRTSATAVGEWAREQFEAWGLVGEQATFALSRSDVVIKEISLPAAANDATLPDLVRVQMVRQMAFAASSAAIDFVERLIEDDSEKDSEAPTRRGVLAVAAGGERIAWVRELTEAAGLRCAGVTTRAFGLVGVVSERVNAGAVLVIAPGAGQCELAIIDRSGYRFGRTVDAFAPKPGDEVARTTHAQRLVTEAKRTLASWGLAGGASIESVVVLSDDQSLADAFSDALKLTVNLSQVDADGDVPGSGATQAVLRAIASSESPINLTAPKRATDPRARLKLWSVVAVVAVLAISVSAWLVTSRELDGLRRQASSARSDVNDVLGRYRDASKQRAITEHLAAWMDSGQGWIGELQPALTTLAADEVRIARLSAGADVREAVSMDRRVPRFPATWSRRVAVDLTLRGAVVNPDARARLRERLLATDGFTIRNLDPDNESDLAFGLDRAMVGVFMPGAEQVEPEQVEVESDEAPATGAPS